MIYNLNQSASSTTYTERKFPRKIYSHMLNWKNSSNGKTALLIEGPRRVGKSTIVKEFAQNEYESYILVDFYTASPEVKQLFEDLSDLNYIFLQLQLIYKTSLKERKSCIIFDEVQLCPKARQAIKALVNDGRYDYIETGSLISIHKNVKNILIPSEERKLKMHPMDYEEFKWALGDNTTIPLLKKLYDSKKPIGQAACRKMLRDFRLYMLVGGMPQAVESYIEANDFSAVDRVKRDILSLYEDDFRKIDPTGKISAIFDSIPAQLMSNTSRYHVSSVLAGNRANTVLEQLAQLEDSGTVLISHHTNDPNSGMAQHKDLSKFKLFLADTGLFVTLVFKDKSFTSNDIYMRLLNDKLQVNLGYVYENIVAQTLSTHGHELYYHTFMDGDARLIADDTNVEIDNHDNRNNHSKCNNRNYEVDFLIADKNKIVPIEVKSSGYKTHASLDTFARKFSSRIAREILIYTKDYLHNGMLEYIPIVMTEFL
ncbi:ATP-binding protein [Gardnerella vaginalis]|uniref:ATP-binding protein n=1 Tax=Gardnerella vaginalis TaxID=2702 RepID=UPI000C7DA475|nr:AAA family ATPase [Gardnerella vaginalis]NSX29996.1 ATP-binding protein [Gardnerella vaginalis]PKZ47514.1 ATPase [Gardnerella vaginalis]